MSEMEEPKRMYVRCLCGSDEHIAILEYDKWNWNEDEPLRFTISPAMDLWLPWWRRIWVAARYICGRPYPRYGHYHAIALEICQVEEMRAFVAAFLREVEQITDPTQGE